MSDSLQSQVLKESRSIAHQAPLSMEFSRQEYWCGLPFPSPGNLADPGIEAGSPALQVDPLLSESPGKTQHFSDIVDIQICAFQMD